MSLYALPVTFQMFPSVRLVLTFSDFGLRSSFYIHIYAWKAHPRRIVKVHTEAVACEIQAGGFPQRLYL